MRVQKRGDRGFEEVHFDKITSRIRGLCDGLSLLVDPFKIAQLTIRNIYDGIKTEQLDKISAELAESMKTIHPDYSKLAARLSVSNLHKNTPNSFSTCMRTLYALIPNFSDSHFEFIMANAKTLDDMIDESRDYQFDYPGFVTLEKGYLWKVRKMENDTEIEHVIDRPQYMYMRASIGVHYRGLSTSLANIKQCYDELSNHYYTFATPTYHNACTKSQQLTSCFLLGTEDSRRGILKTLTDASLISCESGGLGIWMHCIRSAGSLIKGCNGRSNGLIDQLRVYDTSSTCWNQGGKRKGAFAIYLEIWHGDIMKFLRLKLNQGAETERARNLFYGLWIPDLFVIRALDNDPAQQMWSLFSDDTAPGLHDLYDGMEVCKHCGYCANTEYAKYFDAGPKCAECVLEPVLVFTILYTRYEREGRQVGRINAREVLDAICDMQRESGTPYMCYKDHVNRMSNQSNIGTVKSSNLCTEIMEVSTKDSYACCTLASINLKKFITKDGDSKYTFDHSKLFRTVGTVVRNLNKIIDVNQYPVDECRVNSDNYRPIGIGIQGLADIFAIMRIPFLSAEAERLDIEISETIYVAAYTESARLAEVHGSYKGFEGSPANRGLLHIDMWLKNQQHCALNGVDPRSTRYDWNGLRSVVSKGMYNSLCIAYMPTVSTSFIIGNNESFEPFPSNIYSKATQVGKFTMVNKYMIEHFIEMGIWNESMRQSIISNEGSVQHIEGISRDIAQIYLTVWEMKQSELMRRTALRSAFVDQSQSLNIYIRENSNAVLRGVMFAGWKLGLKTGSYYIRTRPAAAAMKNNIAAVKEEINAGPVCFKEEGCVVCSS